MLKLLQEPKKNQILFMNRKQNNMDGKQQQQHTNRFMFEYYGKKCAQENAN